MLYPSLNELIAKVGSRYLLVNTVAKKAREIADEAIEKKERLDEKPVKLAILEIAKQKDKK